MSALKSAVPGLTRVHGWWRSNNDPSLRAERKLILQQFLTELCQFMSSEGENAMKLEELLLAWLQPKNDVSTFLPPLTNKAFHHSLSLPDKEGWLYKEDEVSKQVSLSWIVLKRSFMYFFKSQVCNESWRSYEKANQNTDRQAT